MAETNGSSGIVPAIIGSAGPLLGELAHNVAMNRNLRMQNKYNKSMADYQYQLDTAFWERQNAYNSPQAQMERLKAAGLNPNLVYGSGTVAGNTSGTMPKYNAPSASFDFKPYVPSAGLVTSLIGLYQDIKVKQAQVDNLNQQTESKRLDNDLKLFRLSYEKTYDPYNYFYRNRKLEYESAGAGFKADLARYQADIQAEVARKIKEKIALDIENMRLKNAATEKEITFKNIRNEQANWGVTSGDSAFLKILMRILSGRGFQGFN